MASFTIEICLSAAGKHEADISKWMKFAIKPGVETTIFCHKALILTQNLLLNIRKLSDKIILRILAREMSTTGASFWATYAVAAGMLHLRIFEEEAGKTQRKCLFVIPSKLSADARLDAKLLAGIKVVYISLDVQHFVRPGTPFGVAGR